uniref:Uncharacterized protein n=1 Tax=Romanomermis culicivorax TaxID=13658 RepID=A0A915JY19_ROMCU
MAKAASAIISPAPAPTIWAPKIRSVALSPIILTKPSASLFVLARLLAINGNLPILYYLLGAEFNR